MNTTQIYDSYEDFLNRADKSLNGVSQFFANCNPNYEEQNKTNKGCWDCHNCEKCSECVSCNFCEDCSNCNYCLFSTECENCDYCTKCRRCNKCTKCKGCKECFLCHNCEYLEDCSEYTADKDRKKNNGINFYME